MTKIVLNDITNVGQVSVINDNFDKIEQEFNDKVLYRLNPVGEPNSLNQDLDANGNDIFNVGALSAGSITIDGVDLENQLQIAVDAAADAAASAATAAHIYSGVFTSDPLTRPDGSPKQDGDLYFNSVSNLTFRWNGNTWISSDLDIASLAAPDGSSLIGFIQQGAGAVASTLQAKARQRVSIYDFMTEEQITQAQAELFPDVSVEIQKAIDELKGRGGGWLDLGYGGLGITQELVCTDATVYLVGAGITGLTIKALAVIPNMIRFDTATLVGGDRIPTGGVIGMTLDGNSLAVNGLRTRSVNYGNFDQIRAKSCTGWQVLADCIAGKPSSQHNRFGTIEAHATVAGSGAMKVTGAEAENGNSNFSLNYLENIYTLQSNVASFGFVFGFTDANFVSHLRNFRTPGSTAFALEFLGDDSVAADRHARLNVISHFQAGGAGCIARTGATRASGSNRIICYSLGNGSPRPVIESGATLAYQTNTSGNQGTFTPTLFGTSAAGTPTYTTQKGRWEKIGSRIFFDLQVTISAVGGISGNVRIGGLPSSMPNNTGTDVRAGATVHNFTATLPAGFSIVTASVAQGSDYLDLFKVGSGNTATLLGSNLTGVDSFSITGSFPAFEFS